MAETELNSDEGPGTEGSETIVGTSKKELTDEETGSTIGDAGVEVGTVGGAS